MQMELDAAGFDIEIFLLSVFNGIMLQYSQVFIKC